MGVGASLYMYDVVVKKFTFAISSADEFLSILMRLEQQVSTQNKHFWNVYAVLGEKCDVSKLKYWSISEFRNNIN